MNLLSLYFIVLFVFAAGERIQKYDTLIAMPFHLFLCLQNGYLHASYILRTLHHMTSRLLTSQFHCHNHVL